MARRKPICTAAACACNCNAIRSGSYSSSSSSCWSQVSIWDYSTIFVYSLCSLHGGNKVFQLGEGKGAIELDHAFLCILIPSPGRPTPVGPGAFWPVFPLADID